MFFIKLFNLFVIVFLLLIGITFANNNQNKEDETEGNSIGVMSRNARQYVSSFMPSNWEKSSLLANIAMPALFLLFLSSVSNVRI